MVVAAMEPHAPAPAAFHRLLYLRERLLRAREIAGLEGLTQGLKLRGEGGDDGLRPGRGAG